LHEENEEREAELVVASIHRGVVGDGGSTGSGGGAVGVSPLPFRLQRKKKGRTRET
jgi:hypothetical protein